MHVYAYQGDYICVYLLQHPRITIPNIMEPIFDRVSYPNSPPPNNVVLQCLTKGHRWILPETQIFST